MDPKPEKSGGSGEIRTHGALSDPTVFKTVAINRSATLPNFYSIKDYNTSPIKFSSVGQKPTLAPGMSLENFTVKVLDWPLKMLPVPSSITQAELPCRVWTAWTTFPCLGGPETSLPVVTDLPSAFRSVHRVERNCSPGRSGRKAGSSNLVCHRHGSARGTSRASAPSPS